MGAISLTNINKSFGTAHVIKDVNIDIADGEFVVFVGPSGCGKSTLLRLIAGLEDITSGDLQIAGQTVNELQPKERGVAMVFQSYAIFPHMTVRENIAFGLTIRREAKAEVARKVAEAARILKMEDLLDRRPSQLSGGQRQRVAIGRAIVRDPTVFLFDEPLSNLDAALRMSTRQEIAALHEQLKTTMVYVTHDQVEAMTLADKIVVLKDGQVMQIGAPIDLYHNPANLFVAKFLGAPAMNFLPVTVDAQSDETVIVSGPQLTSATVPRQGRSFEIGQAATFGIRPQFLRLSPDGGLKGMVTMSERLGPETVVELATEDGTKLTAVLAEDAILKTGEQVAFQFDDAQAHVFAETL